MRRLSASLAVAGVCAALLLSGCSRQHYEERGKADAPVAGRAGEDSPAEVYNFPDGFGNLATKCVGAGRRAYATTRSVRQKDDDDTEIIPAHAVIVDDPTCRVAR
ncbi:MULTISPECIES: hypothetical protein [unclassified Streptomyces]|uniref:hypothetical protein n=1 Tax=unclassified Streptomyces TaxID=2593676 RepID=UPI0019150F19|nr:MULTISPECIES: hypothetical protein [unclassified Streptomyces]WKE70351.1 hypothetical protein QHG49_15525 [Streptomyces sp. WP-1]